MKEQNKHSLHKAISKLPHHHVDDGIWGNIEAALEDVVLHEAINELPKLAPKEDIWDSIASELTLKESIAKLAQHSPPEGLWNEIDKKVDAPVVHLKRASSYYYWLSGVAAVLLLGFILFPLLNTNEKTQISYSEELIEVEPIEDWNATTQDLEMMLEDLCEQNPRVCKSPEFEELNAELQFLDASKIAVLEQINPYEDRKEAEVLLTKIELERVEVLKKLIAQTIV